MANLYVFHQGANTNGSLWYTWFNGATWSLDTPWGGGMPVQNLGMSGSPSAVVWRGGISVLHQGFADSGDLWYSYSPDGQHWGGDTPWGQPNFPVQGLGISGSPSAVVYNDLLYVFHQGANANGSLWYSQFNGDFWTPDTPIRYANMSASPSAVLWEGGISVFFQGGGDDGILWYVYSPDGAYQNFGAPTGWGYPFGPPITASLRMSQSPSCVVYGHRREP